MNPIEQKRLKSEAKWDKERAKDAERKAKREKSNFLKAEGSVLAVKQEEASKKKRAELGSTPLGLIQRDFVNFLRNAHRAVTLEEVGQAIRYNVAENEELLESLRNHPRVRVKGKMYAYQSRYDISDINEMLELIEKNDEGIIAKELNESYYEASKDIDILKKEGKILAFPNKQLQSEILFGCGSKYDVQMAQSLKESWHLVFLPDIKKLTVDMERMGLPIAKAPPALKQTYRRSKAQKKQKTAGKVVKDTYNAHVPDWYKDDSWKDNADLMYQKNTI